MIQSFAAFAQHHVAGYYHRMLEQLPFGHAGCDEVGRGPLIGDVVAAAVMFHGRPPEGIRDSKKLSAKKRTQLAGDILAVAHVAFGHATPEEIDQIGIHKASLTAMKRAVESLSPPPIFVAVDGKFLPELAMKSSAIIGGDDKILEIAASSIVAKVRRDGMMGDLHQRHPEYGFDRHHGYPTKAHLEALRSHGVLPQHRRSYRPVRDLLAVKNDKNSTPDA